MLLLTNRDYSLHAFYTASAFAQRRLVALFLYYFMPALHTLWSPLWLLACARPRLLADHDLRLPPPSRTSYCLRASLSRR